MNDIKAREKVLCRFIEKQLPKFAQAVKEAIDNEPCLIVMHQDAYAGDYQDSEYYLLGAAMKYAGLKGVTEIRMIGKNRETIDK